MQSSSLGPLLSLSPSFDTYSSSKLAEIAARVVQEFRTEPEIDDMLNFATEEIPWSKAQEQRGGEEEPEIEKENNEQRKTEEKNEEEEDDDDFEFAFVTETSPISADEIFYNGQIRPMFPLFNRDLLEDAESEKLNHEHVSKPPIPSSIRVPLRKLLIGDRDSTLHTSSEAEELDGIPSGTYCVWTPKTAEAAKEGRCKKSNSTGSSKRWKFRDLLHRSNSDGKDTLVFLTPSPNLKKKEQKKVTGEGVGGRDGDTVATQFSKSGATKAKDRRRSYLPYRQDLVGFFANVNGLNRKLQPF